MLKKIIILTLVYTVSGTIQAQSSLDYDGIDDYVQTSYDGILGDNQRTVECWFKTSQNAGQMVLVDWGINNASEKFTFSVLNGKLNVDIGGSSMNSQSSVSDGVWHHGVVTYYSSFITLFIDGGFEATSSVGPLNTSSSLDVRIGRGLDDLNHFNGEIDEVRVWDYAKTQEHIMEDMFHELSGSESGLTAYYSKEGSNPASNGVIDFAASNNGSMMNMNTSSITDSYAPVRQTNAQYNICGIWEATSLSNSLESDGLWMNVNTPLTEPNYATFGHDGAGSAIVTTDLPSGLVNRYKQSWYIEVQGTVISNITFDLSTIYGAQVQAGLPSGYKLLFRNGTSGVFTDIGTGSSVANNDQVTFSNVNLTDGFYTMGSSDLNSPLPVELISFSADLINKNMVKLAWETASEINNDYFIIQRSINGIEWESIDKIAGNGNTLNVTKYEIFDQEPMTGLSYYRLLQSDYNGNYTYSKVASVYNNKSRDLIIYPNPAESHITLSVENQVLDQISIYNALGAEVTTRTSFIDHNVSKKTIDLSGLNAGVYYIKYNHEIRKFYKL